MISENFLIFNDIQDLPPVTSKSSWKDVEEFEEEPVASFFANPTSCPKFFFHFSFGWSPPLKVQFNNTVLPRWANLSGVLATIFPAEQDEKKLFKQNGKIFRSFTIVSLVEKCCSHIINVKGLSGFSKLYLFVFHCYLVINEFRHGWLRFTQFLRESIFLTTLEAVQRFPCHSQWPEAPRRRLVPRISTSRSQLVLMHKPATHCAVAFPVVLT